MAPRRGAADQTDPGSAGVEVVHRPHAALS